MFAALIIVGFVINQKISAKTSVGKINPQKDLVLSPKIENIADTLVLAGSVDTDQIASVRFQNSGKLVWVGVKVGDRVKKWQALASLDKNELKKNLQTQYNDYRTQLSEFQDTQDTYKSTREKYLVTDTIQRILDRTQYSLNNSVIDYEISEMTVKEATIYSPIEGIVVAIDQPLPGANITPATATFTIINPEGVYFKANIDQESVNKIKVGQDASLNVDAFPERTLKSQISYIAFTPVSGQTSTEYEVRFNLPINNQELNYRLGMDGDASIIISQADSALTIPTDAIHDDNGQYFVYIKENQKSVRRNVKIGIENDSSTQIIEGLNPNEQVVITQK
jgi:macrolide-specific efflux system membrane fusion protein